MPEPPLPGMLEEIRCIRRRLGAATPSVWGCWYTRMPPTGPNWRYPDMLLRARRGQSMVLAPLRYRVPGRALPGVPKNPETPKPMDSWRCEGVNQSGEPAARQARHSLAYAPNREWPSASAAPAHKASHAFGKVCHCACGEDWAAYSELMAQEFESAGDPAGEKWVVRHALPRQEHAPPATLSACICAHLRASAVPIFRQSACSTGGAGPCLSTVSGQSKEPEPQMHADVHSIDRPAAPAPLATR